MNFFFQVKLALVTRDIERHIGHVMTVTMIITRNARTVNVVLKFTMATARCCLNNKTLHLSSVESKNKFRHFREETLSSCRAFHFS